MTLPGTTITRREEAAGSSSDVDTATLFMTGFTERGSSGAAVLSRDLDEYVRQHGGRETGYTTMYDCAEAFFREGGSRLYVGRVVGPSPTLATVTLDDVGAADSIRVDAKNPGAWGADLDVIIAAGDVADTFTVTIQDDGETVEASGDLADVDEAVAWASVSSDYVDIVALGSDDPATGTFSLVGGTDDKSNATDATWENALNLFSKDLGPGQVTAPGRTTSTAHGDLLDHAAANNRHALLDYADTANESTLIAAVGTDRDHVNAEYGSAWGPWAVIPGVAVGTTRTVPYSVIQAGIIARLEAQGNSPNIAAAGDNGRAQYATDLSQDPWTDSEREELNDGGFNVARIRNGLVTTYGYRTLVDPVTAPAWLQVTAARTAMGIVADCESILERYVFAQIDGKGKKLSQLQGELIGVCLPYHSSGALYGETPQDSFSVNVGGAVNPPEQLAAGVVRAVISVRISPFAERVELELVKTEITEVLA